MYSVSCGHSVSRSVKLLFTSQFTHHGIMLMLCPRAGLTLTQAWTTANALDTKLELDNNIAKGLKAEILTQYLPTKQSKGARLNLHFQQPNLHARAFFDLLNGPTANFDAVLGHEGFLVGAEGGYDVQKAAITKYSAAIGYSVPQYTAAITAGNNLSIFSASYYHRVNAQVEAGAKASWDSKTGNSVGLEVASKYRLDPSSFAKVCDLVIFFKVYVCVCMKFRLIGLSLPFNIGQDQRPWYCRSGLQRPPPPWCHPWPRCFL